MHLQKIILKNFQKHSDLQINFVNGVNVVHGDSEVGKSCIKHSIEFLCQHDSFKGQRKIGTKITSVKGEFSNGCIVERIISSSINRYILTKDGEEKEYNSVGKNAPDEIKEAIGIYPIIVDGEEIFLNSQSQIALPFLFDKSPSFRMKLFNKLTGNDVLDKLFGQFNKDILRIKRGYKEEVEKFKERATLLKEKKKEKEKAEAIYSRLSIRIKNLKNLYEKYSKLLKIKELSEINNEHFKETKLKLKNLKFPEDTAIKELSINIERFEQLKTLKNASEKAHISLGKVRGQLSDLELPELNLDSLKGKIERYEALKYINNIVDSNKVGQTQTKEEIRDTKIILKDKIVEYKKLLKECKICPLCQTECTEEHLKEIKL